MSNKFLVLNRVENFNHHSGKITEIVSFNEGKFKITSDVHNGGRDIDVYKMDGDGIFKFVLGKSDLPNHPDGLSYVSDVNEKKRCLEVTLKGIKKVIASVYSV